MGNLPELRKELSIAVHNPEPGTKAIDLRRKMLDVPEVANALTLRERYIFAASTKTQIGDTQDDVLVDRAKQIFHYIALDVGFVKPQNESDWIYMCTRLAQYLKMYYPQLTLSEVKLSFELAAAGELNEFLPLRNGEPDKGHYQQFNVDYFAKILNAYVKKQSRVFIKATQAVPALASAGLTSAEKKQYNQRLHRETLEAYLFYKYRGVMPDLSAIKRVLMYNVLVSVGLAQSVVVTHEETRAALSDMLRRASNHELNEFTAHHVRKQGVDNEDVKSSAFLIAREKALQYSFDQIIKEEIQLSSFL